MTDLTAKARRAAEWFCNGPFSMTAFPSGGENHEWVVEWKTERTLCGVPATSTARVTLTELGMVSFAEALGWHDQEQEADGVEWHVVTETTTIGRFNVWLYPHDGQWRWDLQDINDNDAYVFSSEEMIPTREEARRQAVEAARGIGNA